MINYHKYTRPRNVINKSYILLDRRYDKYFDSQLYFYLNYDPDMHRIDFEMIDVVMINLTKLVVTFIVDKKGRGFNVNHMPRVIYFKLKKYRRELRKGLKYEKSSAAKQIRSYSDRYEMFYDCFGINELCRGVRKDIVTLSIPYREEAKKIPKVKLHRFHQLKYLFVQQPMILKTIPDNLMSIRIVDNGKSKRMSCLDGFDKTVLRGSTLYMR